MTTPTLAALVAACCVEAGGASALPASQPPTDPDPQTEPADPRVYENRPVRRVLFRAVEAGPDGRPVFREPRPYFLGLVQNQVRTAPGAIFLNEVVQADVALINRLGAFAEVTVSANLNPDGSVDVVYTLAEQDVIEDVRLRGNASVPSDDLAAAAALLPGTAIDRFQLDSAAREMERIYRQRGFNLVRVTWEAEPAGEGRSIITFRIVEGSRVKVTGIEFEGADAFTRGQLLTAIETRISTLLDREPLDDDALDRDVVALTRFYNDRGYLDAEVDRLPPRISPNGEEAIVSFVVREGPRAVLRSVQVYYPHTVEPGDVFPTREQAESAAEPGEEVYATPTDFVVYTPEPFSSAQIAGLMQLKVGDALDGRRLRESIATVRAAFGRLGYVGAGGSGPTIVPRQLRDPADPSRVDLILEVAQNSGAFNFPFGDVPELSKELIGEVNVVGNELTKRNVVQREFDGLRPGRPLDATEISDLRRRLARLGIFDRGDGQTGSVPDPRRAPQDVVQPTDPRYPGMRDILVRVTETNTARINLGGVVGSDLGFVGSISYIQENFDLFDLPDSPGDLVSGRAFSGAGL